MLRALCTNTELTRVFVDHCLTRSHRLQQELMDFIFKACEKRLARALLRLANSGTRSPAEIFVSRISQETLAEIVGTSRQRVNYFMNKFRKAGIISHCTELQGKLKINRAMLESIIQD